MATLWLEVCLFIQENPEENHSHGLERTRYQTTLFQCLNLIVRRHGEPKCLVLGWLVVGGRAGLAAVTHRKPCSPPRDRRGTSEGPARDHAQPPRLPRQGNVSPGYQPLLHHMTQIQTRRWEFLWLIKDTVVVIQIQRCFPSPLS